MFEKELKELEKFIGTNTLVHVKVNDYGLHKDLFIACEHLYAQVNGEKVDSTLVRLQVENIIRSFYNIQEDNITDFYANLEDSYRPQYTSRVPEKYKNYQVIEFLDYKLPLISIIEKEIKDYKIEIIAKKVSQATKLKLIFEFLGLKDKLGHDTKYPDYIVTNKYYYDKFTEDLADNVDSSYLYTDLYDKSFNDYHKFR